MYHKKGFVKHNYSFVKQNKGVLLNIMARPTNEVKKHYVGIRLTDNEYESLGENKSEAIRELINSVKQNGFVKQNESNVKQNEDSFVKQNSESEQSFVKQYPYDIDKLISSLEGLVDNGDLVIFGSEVVVNKGFENDYSYLGEELKNLSDACSEKGISVKDAIRKTAQSIWSIRQ